MRIITDNQGN